MLRSRENVIAVSSLVLAAYLMLPVLSAGPLVLDEHAAYWLSAPQGTLSVWERSSRYAAVPPLTCWFQETCLLLFGETELALRLPSVLGYLVAVGVMAFGGRPDLGRTPAGLAAAALAVHPDVVDEVRVGRTYGLVVLWTTLLLLITLRWSRRTVNWRDGLLWGMTAAAAVWTHILTIPVVGISALLLVLWDYRRARSLVSATIPGGLIVTLSCVPLIPMGMRIWEWRYALNYQTGSASLATGVGPFIWLSLPIAVVVALGVSLTRRRAPTGTGPRTTDYAASAGPRWAVAAALGLLPLMLLVLGSAGELSSLAHPRYRAPLAAANSCLLGLLCSIPRSRILNVVTLGAALVAAWMVVGQPPQRMIRLNTPQSFVWKDIGETLERTVRELNLEQSPVFVQSGLIEGVLIPVFPDDMQFHGYVSSRLGRFYAHTGNPRYALPMFWGGDNRQVMEFFGRVLSETAGRDPNDLFVAIATDTDVNRASFATFAEFLDQFGYKGDVIAGQQPWAVLYHYRRREAAPDQSSEAALD